MSNEQRWSVDRQNTHGRAFGMYFVLPASGIYDRCLVLRVGRRSVALRRDRQGQPWPIVAECHHALDPGHVCPQHDPGHEHTWQAGKPLHPAGRQVPVRCVVCGGRKCDRPRCIRIRHHDEDHSDWLGYNGQVEAVSS